MSKLPEAAIQANASSTAKPDDLMSLFKLPADIMTNLAVGAGYLEEPQTSTYGPWIVARWGAFGAVDRGCLGRKRRRRRRTRGHGKRSKRGRRSGPKTTDSSTSRTCSGCRLLLPSSARLIRRLPSRTLSTGRRCPPMAKCESPSSTPPKNPLQTLCARLPPGGSSLPDAFPLHGGHPPRPHSPKADTTVQPAVRGTDIPSGHQPLPKPGIPFLSPLILVQIALPPRIIQVPQPVLVPAPVPAPLPTSPLRQMQQVLPAAEEQQDQVTEMYWARITPCFSILPF